MAVAELSICRVKIRDVPAGGRMVTRGEQEILHNLKVFLRYRAVGRVSDPSISSGLKEGASCGAEQLSKRHKS